MITEVFLVVQRLEPACQCRKCRFDLGSGKIPWRRTWQPTPVFLSGKPHGLRILVGYSPWGCKESDTTERLHFHYGKSMFNHSRNHQNVIQSSGTILFSHQQRMRVMVSTHSRQPLSLFDFFDSSHSYGCEVMSHCDFDL